MEQWNNVELSDLSKKSYTLNHEFDLASKPTTNGANNNEETSSGEPSGSTTTQDGGNGADSDLLQPGSDIKPKVNLEDVEALVRRLYGITTSEIKELISYDDRNFLIHEDRNIKNPLIVSPWPHGYVLKILNGLDSKKTDFVDAQNKLMVYLSEQQIQCSRPISNVNGKYFSVERIGATDHVVRLLEFIPGKLLHQVAISNYLLYQSGEYLAKINRALKNFTHEAYETRKSLWMLQSIPQLKDFIYVLEDHSRKSMVEEIIAAFETNVLSQLDTFEKQIIHGDYNEQNIIVAPLAPQQQQEHKVAGIIDFGDTQLSPLIFEIGIGMTYMLLQAKTLASGGIFLAGYDSVRPIGGQERQYLKYCVAARLAQSLTLGFYTYTQNPSNSYVLVTQAEGWKMLENLWCDHFQSVDELWQTTADQYLTQSGK